ncbi:MAG: TRIC cation channel family protein [Actinomycetota bacterium]
MTDTSDLITGVLGTVQSILEHLGVVAFAISGALVACRKRMDLVGVVVLGVIVAVGGGTIRDLVVQRTVFWVDDPTFLAMSALAAICSVPALSVASRQMRQGYWLVQSFDAIGLALFVVTGTNIALESGASAVAAAVIGIVSGMGGGVIRDVLANEVPQALIGGRFYTTAALVGSSVYIVLLEMNADAVVVLWIPILIVLALRFVSLRYRIGVPTFGIDAGDDPSEPPQQSSDTASGHS